MLVGSVVECVVLSNPDAVVDAVLEVDGTALDGCDPDDLDGVTGPPELAEAVHASSTTAPAAKSTLAKARRVNEDGTGDVTRSTLRGASFSR